MLTLKLLVGVDYNVDVEKHTKTVLADTFSCKNCDFVTSNIVCLEKHAENIHTLALKIFSCDMCNIDFSDKKYLFIHKDLDHVNAFNSDVKMEMYDNENEIEESLNNMEVNDSINEFKTFKCGLCSKTFESKNNLKKHNKNCHFL